MKAVNCSELEEIFSFQERWRGLMMTDLHVVTGMWLLNINMNFQFLYHVLTRALCDGVYSFWRPLQCGWVTAQWRGEWALFEPSDLRLGALRDCLIAESSMTTEAYTVYHQDVLPSAILEVKSENSCWTRLCRFRLASMSKHLCLCETEWGVEWMKRWCLSVPFCRVVSCRVDASNLEGTSLHIKKLRAVSACKMKINSVPKEEITVSSDSELSFQDCLPEDLQITAMRTIGTFILTNVLLCISRRNITLIKKNLNLFWNPYSAFKWPLHYYRGAQGFI